MTLHWPSRLWTVFSGPRSARLNREQLEVDRQEDLADDVQAGGAARDIGRPSAIKFSIGIVPEIG